MSLRDVHLVLGWVVVFANAMAGLWALAAHWVTALRSRALWVVVALSQILIGVEVIIGVIDMRVRSLQVNGVHLFYGFIALFTAAIIYSYRQQLERWRYLLYGLGGLFLMGLALRSVYIPAL